MNDRNKMLALVILGCIGIMAISGSVLLAWHGKQTPDHMTALVGAVIGGLVTFIALKNGDKP